MDPQLRFLIPIKIGFSKLLPSLEDIHVIDVDVAEPDGADFLASSILEDWDKRARFGNLPSYNDRTTELVTLLKRIPSPRQSIRDD